MGEELGPGNELPGYSQEDRDKSGPGNELPGYSQLSLRDRKIVINPAPAMNCRAILSCPYGTGRS